MLLGLLLLLPDSSGQTAYLVGSMQQTYEASNSSFNSLGGVIRAQPAYSTIVLTEDYCMSPGEFQAADPVRLSQPLLITSSPGEQHQLSFAFLVRPQSSGRMKSCCPGRGRQGCCAATCWCLVFACRGGVPCRHPKWTASRELRCRVGADGADGVLPSDCCGSAVCHAEQRCADEQSHSHASEHCD